MRSPGSRTISKMLHWHGKVEAHQPFGLNHPRIDFANKNTVSKKKEKAMSRYSAERCPCFHTWMDAGMTNSAAKATKLMVWKAQRPTNQQEHQRHAVQRHQRIEKLEIGGAFLARSKNRLTNKMVTPKMPMKCTKRIPNQDVLPSGKNTLVSGEEQL